MRILGFRAKRQRNRDHLGTLDQPNLFTPQYELRTDRRETWLPDFPGVQGFSRGRSENDGS